jgi:Abnormal spindle-like microcephaly-assoc'd, ASPM-SPD-2-Hydin
MRCLGSPQRPAFRILILFPLLLIPIAATAQMSLSASNVSFGSVQVGNSVIVPVAVTNTGKQTITISQATVSGSGFSFVGPNLPITVAPQKNVSLSISFAPQTSGSISGNLSISYSASWGGKSTLHSSSVTVALSGTGQAGGYLTAPSSMNLGSVAIGSSQAQALTISNSGGASVAISGATVSGSGFSVSGLTFPYTLPAGGSASLSVTFTPSTTGTDNATLSISSNASNSTVAVSLTGTTPTAGYLSAPASLSLGSVAVGSSRTQALALSNSGGSSLTISSATVSGTGFSVSGLTFPYTLPAGGSASLSVIFTPSTTGTDSATLSLSSNASDPNVGVSLTGSGTTSSGTLGVTPGSMSFGSITIGTTQTQSGTLTASGGSVTVSSSSSSNSAFTLGGFTLPVTLAAGQNLPFTVTFAPTSTATASANVSFFTSNSTSASETASGSGATIQHTVDLSWSASTSSSISGYNVYRGTVSGGPYTRITSALDFSLNYSDSTVQSGQTYYYVTTAVDSSGAESSYSSQVQAVIPFP